MRLIITTVIASFWMISSANAAIYKCVAADDAISYSQTECPVDAAAEHVVKVYGRPKSAGKPRPVVPRHTVPQYDHPQFGEGPYNNGED